MFTHCFSYLLQAYEGQEDFENCAICRKVINPIDMVEGDDQAEDSVSLYTTKTSSVPGSRDPSWEQSEKACLSASSLSEAVTVNAVKETGPSETSSVQRSKEPSPNKSLDRILSLTSSEPISAGTKKKIESVMENVKEQPVTTSVQRSVNPSSACFYLSSEPATAEPLCLSLSSSGSAVDETEGHRPSGTASMQKNRGPSSESSLDTHLSSSESSTTETDKTNNAEEYGLSAAAAVLRNTEPSLEKCPVQILSSSSEPAVSKSVKEKKSEKANVQRGTATEQCGDLFHEKERVSQVFKCATVEEKHIQPGESSPQEASAVVQSKILISFIGEERDAVANKSSELCIQKDLHKPISTSTSANMQAVSSPAELRSSDAATSGKAPSLGVPKRSHSADEAADVSNQKDLQFSVRTSGLSNYSASRKRCAPDIAVVRSTRPRPSFAVCSQGSTKQNWQRWKALRMQGKAISDTEVSSQRQSSVSSVGIDSDRCFRKPYLLSNVGSESEGYSLSDVSDSEMGNYASSSGIVPNLSESNTEVFHCTPTGDSEAESENNLHQKAAHMSSSNSGQGAQQKSWPEAGFWLGIDELKTLHKTAKDRVACEDTQAICSLSATKFSPTKLSQLMTVQRKFAEVEDAHPAYSPEQVKLPALVPSQIAALAQVEETDRPKLHAVEKITEIPPTDDTEFFEMVIRETSASEGSSKSVIPGLDLVDHCKPQNTADTSYAATSVEGVKHGDLPKELGVVQKALQELLKDQCHVEDGSVKVILKSSDSGGEHFKEAKQEACLKRQTRDIVYCGEDLDVLGTPNLDSNQFDTRKKRLSFVCKSLERKTRSSTEAVVEADYCDEVSEREDGHSQQDDTLKADQSEAAKTDSHQFLKEGGVSGCPIPSFTSTRNLKKAKNLQDGSIPHNASSPDSPPQAVNERSSCAEIAPPQETGPVFQTSNLRQPPAPGTDSLGPETVTVRQFGHSLPCTPVSHGFILGQPLYRQPMVVHPVLIPNASVSMPNASVHMVNPPLHMLSSSMPMAVPVPMLNSVPMGGTQRFVVYPRQPVSFPRPMVQPLFTGPPPPLPGAMSMQRPPPGSVVQREASSPIDPNTQPCHVTVLCHRNDDQENSVHNTGPSISPVTSKSSSQSFTETAEKSRNDTRCEGDDVIGWFADRENQTKNPPKKDMIDWFSDILDGKRNALSMSELESEPKKARLDFMESLSHKRSRTWDLEEKSREAANSVKRRNSLCGSEDKPKRESASSRSKRVSPCNSEDKTSAKKRKGISEMSRICFRVGFSSGAITKRSGPLAKSVNLDSDSDSEGSVKRTERGSYREYEKSRRETNKGRTPGTSGKATDSKVSTEKERPPLKSSRSLSENSKVLKSRHGPESDHDKKTHSRGHAKDIDSKNLQFQHRDLDDEMNDYAQALLDVDTNVSSLEMVSNKISQSIRKSLSSPIDNIAFDSAVSSQNQSSASVSGSSDQKESTCEQPKSNLTDKPLEFLYFAKEMIMKKLKEEGSGPANSPTCPDQSDNACSGESTQSSLVSLQHQQAHQAKPVHLDSRQSMAYVEISGQNRKTYGAPELTQDRQAKSSSMPVNLTASSLSAITEEEMAKFKDIVMSCMPVTTPNTELSGAGRKSSSSEKGKTVVETDYDTQKKESTFDGKSKTQEVKRQREPSSARRNWNHFLSTSRPAFRRFSSGGIEKNRNYYGDILDAPVAIDNIVPQSERSWPSSATSTSCPTQHTIGTDFASQGEPRPQICIEGITCVSPRNNSRQAKSDSATRKSQHGITRFVTEIQPSSQPLHSQTKASSQASSLLCSFVAAQKPSTQTNSAASSKPSAAAQKRSSQASFASVQTSPTQANSAHAQIPPTKVNSSAAQKLPFEASSACAQKPPTLANSASLPKPSSHCDSANEKPLAPTHTKAATPSMSSIEAITFVASKHSIPATQTESLPTTMGAQIQATAHAASQKSNASQKTSTSAIEKGPTEQPEPSTSSDSIETSNPSTQGVTAQTSNATQGAPSVCTLQDFLLEQFPGVDPDSLAPILAFKLAYNVENMSNKVKKNLVFRVRKHLEIQNKAASPRLLRLEEFAVSQIEIELSLVEGTLKLLEATRGVPSNEVQIGRGGQPIVKHSSTDIVREALMAVVQDFNRATLYADRDWKGRSHQRMPDEVLLSDEQDKLYTKEGAFIMLVTTIPSKPYAKLVQIRMDIEACLNKIGHAACHNKTQVVMQERRRIQQLQLQRLALMKSFTGAVNSSRLRKMKIQRDSYATCQEHLLRVLGVENVSKMVFFRASFEAVQNHLQILETEMVIIAFFCLCLYAWYRHILLCFQVICLRYTSVSFRCQL